MIFTPNDLREFLAVCKADIDEINKTVAVIDDSQMAKEVSQMHVADNLLLVGVLPDYASDSDGDDALMMGNTLDFLILKKVEYSDLSSDDFMDVMHETAMVGSKFIERLIQEKNNPNTCPQFYYLNESSIQMQPVWAKAGTNGYMVSFNLRTNL